jgi:hypothetical protein
LYPLNERVINKLVGGAESISSGLPENIDHAVKRRFCSARKLIPLM